MPKTNLIAVVLFGLLALSACRDEPGDEVVADLVSQYDAGSFGPIDEIWRYRYRGQSVYYIPPKCCDIPSILFGENGEAMCSPDGGLTGKGDGQCPDFFDKRRRGKLVWSAEGEYRKR